MSWDARYVAHARQRARELSPSNRQASCPICCQRLQAGESDAFSSHLTESHSDEIERHSKDPNWNLKDWKRSLELRAGLSITSSNARNDAKSPSNLQQAAQSASRRSPAQEFSDLSLDKPAPPNSLPKFPPDGDPGGSNKKRAGSLSDNSPSHQFTKNPRRDEDQAFKGHHFNDQGQLVSRQLFNPVSEASTSQATLTTHTLSSTPGAQLTSLNQSHRGPASDRTGRSISHDTSSQSSRQIEGIFMHVDSRWADTLMQPDSRPISQEQLAAEVKSIYAGLTMVESKCIHVDRAQALAMRKAEGQNLRLADDHWQALIALHRTLLHEHHDFFLASHHPSASPALKRLAAKYSMPSRMWKHGIHSFLELLRYRLPDSLEFMISFIYTAYQMMSLLYETVPAFEDTWIECLGDLCRYRMAIEDEDIRDRETWSGVARFWYSKAADRTPDVGRLYHHLAILARPNALQQLYLYSRSLISTQPFHSARDSILTLFNPIMTRQSGSSQQISTIDTKFIEIHAILFGKEHPDRYEALRNFFVDALGGRIERVTAKWREQGAYVMIANLAALYDYGTESPLRQLFELAFSKPSQDDQSRSQSTKRRSHPTSDPASQRAYGQALDLNISTSNTVFKEHFNNNNILPFAHILLLFLLSLDSIQSFDFQVEGNYVAASLLSAIPWEHICSFLNALVKSVKTPLGTSPRFESEEFPQGDARPLPEDYLIRGQIWSQKYFPGHWFREGEVAYEERWIEHNSTMCDRAERVLWIAFRLASKNPKPSKWIRYEAETQQWTAVVQKNEMNAPSSVFPLQELTFSVLSEPKDDIMTDADSSYTSDEDSVEMKTLKKEFLSQHRLGLDPSKLWVSAGNIAAATGTILQRDYTVLVCDRTLLLRDRDVFELLVETEWNVVVPHQVFADLSILSKTMDRDSVAAANALNSVKSAYSRESNIRILTATGEDMTKRHLASESPSTPGRNSPVDSTTSPDDKDDLIRVARRATDLNSYDKPIDATEETRSAVLLTDDRLTRVLAKTVKVASLAPGTLRRILHTAKRRIRAASQTSENSDHTGHGRPGPEAVEIFS